MIIKFFIIFIKKYLSTTYEVNNLVLSMTIISVSVPEKLLQRVETSIKDQGFANRSEIVRQPLRAFILENKSLKELEGKIAASVTIIYKREATKGQISEIQHSFGNIISTFLHAHIDEEHCLEVIVVNGDAKAFRKLIDAFHTNEKISQLKVSILKT